MKTFVATNSKHREQNGSTVLVLITLLIIMAMLAVANSKALFHLRREIKRVETMQVERLNDSQTNTRAVAELPARHKSQ